MDEWPRLTREQYADDLSGDEKFIEWTRCDYCGQTGHLVLHGPIRPMNRAVELYGASCYSCGSAFINGKDLDWAWTSKEELFAALRTYLVEEAP